MTWERFAKGRTLVGVDEDDEDFATAGLELGEKTHVLTIDEMPKHNHEIYLANAASSTAYGISYTTSRGAGFTNEWAAGVKMGGDQPHNNIQPSTTVYYWRRVS